MTFQGLAIWAQKAGIWLRQKGVIGNIKLQKLQAELQFQEILMTIWGIRYLK
jgi:hypothetical protein